jgi:mono/diheme cytochrome c family protein
VLAWFDRALALVMWVAAALVVVALFAGPSLIGAKKGNAAAPPAAAEPAAAPGEAVFTSNCASCHTLAAAKATGAVGPNLDQLKPDAATVEAKVTAGGGSMPSFKDRLSAEEIKAVADYVATSAGG